MTKVKEIDIDKVIELAKSAGSVILAMQDSVSQENKSDGSPVTEADKLASKMIVEGLSKITPDIPVISEEEPLEENKKKAKSKYRWIVDPLDGTRTYINGHDGYGVHIGLVVDDVPVLGVVYFPAQENGKGVLYYTGQDGKAYRQTDGDKPEAITVRTKSPDETLKAAVGWPHRHDKHKIMGQKVDRVTAVGGGRLCITAAGEADVAMMNGFFSHWDVAAGHAILRAAGGELVDIKNKKPVRYTSPDLVVPPSAGGSMKTLAGLKLDKLPIRQKPDSATNPKP